MSHQYVSLTLSCYGEPGRAHRRSVGVARPRWSASPTSRKPCLRRLVPPLLSPETWVGVRCRAKTGNYRHTPITVGQSDPASPHLLNVRHLVTDRDSATIHSQTKIKAEDRLVGRQRNCRSTPTRPVSFLYTTPKSPTQIPSGSRTSTG